MTKKIIAFLTLILKKFPVLFVVTVVLLSLSALIGSANILSLSPVVDLLLKHDLENPGPITERFIQVFQFFHIPLTLTSFLAVFLIFIILKNGFLAFSNYAIVRAHYSVVRSLINETYTLCFNSRWHFFSSNNQGLLLNTFNREINNVGTLFAVMGNLSSNAIRAIFYAMIPFLICWQATLFCIAVSALLLLPLQYLAKIGYHLGEKGTRSGNRYMDGLQETLGAAKLILGFGNQHKNIESIDNKFYQYRTAMVRSKILETAIHLLYEPLFVGVLVGTLYLTLYYYSVPLSETLVMYYAFHSLMLLFGQLGSRYHAVFNLFPSYEQVLHLQLLARQQAQTTGTTPFRQLKNAIVLQHVHFTYPERNQPVLQDINITIPKGKMIALVGGSGVGKTTLLDVIMGFYEPNHGSITIDGTPLQEYDIYSFRQRIGFVPQDTVLFNLSIRENLMWSNARATQKDLYAACKLANAHTFITELPQGYDTIVGDRGIRLSVGQRQRIALARAIIRKPELLFLDEATSALDSESERLIQQSIEKIAKDTTIVVIAHRLSTITRADYIYVLEKGQIIEEGSFDELIAHNNVFHRMVELQKL